MVLKFKFKGDRDYVHGTDMINKFLDVYKNISKFSIRIKKMTTKNLRITQKASNQVVVATISIKEHHEEQKFFLAETETGADGRYPYDEKKLLSDSKVDNNKEEISMNLDVSYNLIENLVALNKQLVSKVVSSNVKWLFVGMELEQIPDFNNSDCANLKIEKKLGIKLIKSSIWINEKKIGSISFSAIKKR